MNRQPFSLSTRTLALSLAYAVSVGPGMCAAFIPTPTPTPQVQTPVQTPVVAPVQPVQAIQTTPTATTTTTTQVNFTVPTNFPNPLLLPTDQNQGFTGNSLGTKLANKLPPVLPAAILPDFIKAMQATPPGNLTVEELPTNATIIDTSDASGSDHLVPIGYIQGALQSGPLFGGVSNNGPVVVRVNDKRSEFFICSEDARLIQGDSTGDKDGLVVGAPGTVFTNSNGVLTLHAGRAIVQTGSGIIRIATRVGGIKIGAGATVFVDYSAEKVLTVAVLAARQAGAVKVRSSHDRETVVDLSAGDQFVAADTMLAGEPGQLLANGHAIKERIERNEIQTAVSQLVQPEIIGQHAIHRLALTARSYMPAISRKQNEPSRGKTAVRLFSCEGSAFSANKAGEIHVYYGHVFMSMPQKTTVATNISDVACEAGTTLSMSRLPGLFRVQLFDSPSNATVVCGSSSVALDKGQEVLLADHYPAQSEALPVDGTGRRQFVLKPLDNNVTAILCDFHIFGPIKNYPHLAPMRHPLTTADKQLSENLLKFTAAMQYATADRGNFYYPPSQTSTRPQ